MASSLSLPVDLQTMNPIKPPDRPLSLQILVPWLRSLPRIKEQRSYADTSIPIHHVNYRKTHLHITYILITSTEDLHESHHFCQEGGSPRALSPVSPSLLPPFLPSCRYDTCLLHMMCRAAVSPDEMRSRRKHFQQAWEIRPPAGATGPERQRVHQVHRVHE